MLRLSFSHYSEWCEETLHQAPFLLKQQAPLHQPCFRSLSSWHSDHTHCKILAFTVS